MDTKKHKNGEIKKQKNEETRKLFFGFSVFSLCAGSRSKRGGNTLVETLLYVGLLSIFMVVLVNIFVSIIELKLDTEATSPIEQTGRFLLARIAYDISRASSVTTPATLGSTSGSLVMVINSATYTYQLNGTTLLLTDATDTASTTGSEVTVSGLLFQRLGNSGGKPTVKVQFSLTPVTQKVQGSQTKAFVLTSGLR